MPGVKTATALTTAAAAPSESQTAHNRRQPTRHARTNPNKYLPGASSSRTVDRAPPEDVPPPAEPGFFPGIMHFTDSITMFPREMARHFTQLKEVDAKMFTPQNHIDSLITDLLKAPDTPPRLSVNGGDTQPFDSNVPPTAPSVASDGASIGGVSQAEQSAFDESYGLQRRQAFQMLRMFMAETISTLDEKNHVLSEANIALDRLLGRCKSAWPAIEGELSEEARLGNLNHWAYSQNVEKKQGLQERSRRETAGAARNGLGVIAAEHDQVIGRKDPGQRKGAQHHDVDVEEPKTGKRAGGPGKSKKVAEAAYPSEVGLGIATAGPGAKRRKTGKESAMAVLPLTGEKAMAQVMRGSLLNAGYAKGAGAEATKKRGRGASVTVGAGGRRRAPGSIAANQSPGMTSSPVLGMFGAAPKSDQSPAISAAPTMQRTASARGRQPSNAQTAPPKSAVPTSARSKNLSTPIIDADVPPLKISNSPRLDNIDEMPPNGVFEARPNARTTERTSVKREQSTASRRNRPPSLSLARGALSKVAKSNTPTTTTFNEAQPLARPRSGRKLTGNGQVHPVSSNAQPQSSITPTVNTAHSTPTMPPAGSFENPPKRSHKKGAGIQAQLAAQAAAAKSAGTGQPGIDAPARRLLNTSAASPLNGVSQIDGLLETTPPDLIPDEIEPGVNEEPDVNDENEDRYCYCNGVSYGEMVACDGPECPGQWFHLECTGMKKAPPQDAKWYCEDCKAKMLGRK